MRLNIFYRSPVVWNVILFILFSFFFLYLQEIFYNLSSILKKELIVDFIKSNSLVVFIFIVAIFNVLRLNKHAKSLTVLVIGITLVQTILNLNSEFSKMILVLLFFYLLLFFYVYQFFAMDLEESFYNPKFDKSDLFAPMLTRIDLEIIGKDKEVIEKGFLTNWSAEGCFVRLDSKVELKGLIDIKVSLKGHDFYQTVIIVSKVTGSTGYGLKFLQPKGGMDGKSLGWNEFYEIIEEMGYSPELLA